MNLFTPPKYVNMDIRIDGNAFFIVGRFTKLALKQGWNQSEIDKVINKSKEKDYQHLIDTLMNHIN